MNLKTNNEIIKIHFNTSELGLIVEHMYWNLTKETNGFTNLLTHYKKDIQLYKYLKNVLKDGRRN